MGAAHFIQVMARVNKGDVGEDFRIAFVDRDAERFTTCVTQRVAIEFSRETRVVPLDTFCHSDFHEWQECQPIARRWSPSASCSAMGSLVGSWSGAVSVLRARTPMLA